MGIILDFTGKDKCEKTIRQTWHSFTISLANKKYKYNEVSKAYPILFCMFLTSFSKTHL